MTRSKNVISSGSCSVCGGPIRLPNRLGICQKNRECRNARGCLRRADPAYRERSRSYGRSWYEIHAHEERRKRREYEASRPAWRLFRAARERGARFGVPFEITVEDVEAIWCETCPVFGVPLKVGSGVHGPWSYSLDRIEPAKGYVRGNIQILSRKANVMKQDATREELVQFAKWVLDQEGIMHE